jgi:two-component system, cell cycle sensor histidine kinase and response regulator CckA
LPTAKGVARQKEEIIIQTKPEAKVGNSQKKILVMDDEPILRELAKRILEQLGHVVEVTKDGQAAIDCYQAALLAGYPFDVVLLDLTIPGGMGGKQTMVKLLELDPQVKAVVCSGYSSDLMLSNYQEYGFKDVLVKPYRIKELKSVLERLT